MSAERDGDGYQPGIGLVLGISLGTTLGISFGLLLFDNLALGIGVGIGVGLPIGLAMDVARGNEAGDGSQSDEEGSAARALLWLMVGLAVLVAVIVLTAPELVWTDPAATSELLLFATIAGVPGLALLLWLAYRRRGEDVDTSTSQHPEGHPDQREEG